MDILRGSILETQRDTKAAWGSGSASKSRSEKRGGERASSEMDMEIRSSQFDFRLRSLCVVSSLGPFALSHAWMDGWGGWFNTWMDGWRKP